jgi:glycosyltransferase involved in cell wall biosynthesis
MFVHHVLLRIYRHVDVFIVPSGFLKLKLKDMGFHAPMVRLPHFLDPADFTPSFEAGEPSFIYFGRLARVKGIQTLLRAARGLPLKGKIIGDGELKEDVRRAVQAPGYSGFILKPHLSRGELIEEVKKSAFAVLPSEWYENCPRSVIEAFALGKPVIGARIGGIPELVRDGETGLLFEPGNVRDLREKLMILAENPGLAADMGKKARRLVEAQLNPDVYYSKLMEIYGKARKRCS